MNLIMCPSSGKITGAEVMFLEETCWNVKVVPLHIFCPLKTNETHLLGWIWRPISEHLSSSSNSGLGGVGGGATVAIVKHVIPSQLYKKEM